MTTSLSALIRQVEGSTGFDDNQRRALNGDIAFALGLPEKDDIALTGLTRGSAHQADRWFLKNSLILGYEAPNFLGSLDAAITLFPGEFPHLVPSDPRMCTLMALQARVATSQLETDR